MIKEPLLVIFLTFNEIFFLNSALQVFHMCQHNGRSNAFLCPVGTLFDQRHLVCNWWNKVDCSDAPSYYFVNENIYQ